MTGPPHPLAPVGWSDRVQALCATVGAPDLAPARVVGVERGQARLATAGGTVAVPTTGRGPALAVGDWVLVGGGAVHHALPRWSELGRLGPDGTRQVLAADVDLVLVCTPADRCSPARVEREVVIAWDSGARPVVVLTKADLAPPDLAGELADRLATVDVVPTSAATGAGLDRLAGLLTSPTTAALLGPSGAGKSTLINALVGSDLLAVGAVRGDDRRGRHTTTSRQLVPLPSGGCLIDMPGLRSLGTDADEGAVAATFPDVEELAAACRFADCAHEVEPGCAVTAAAAGGDLDPERLASWRKLVREAAFERRRTDARARQAEADVWKARTKELRQRYRARGRDRDR